MLKALTAIFEIKILNSVKTFFKELIQAFDVIVDFCFVRLQIQLLDGDQELRMMPFKCKSKPFSS